MEDSDEAGDDCGDHPDENNLLEGLTPEQINQLTQLVYEMMLRELRIEQERHGVFNLARAW
jgi:hypothetical protein